MLDYEGKVGDDDDEGVREKFDPVRVCGMLRFGVFCETQLAMDVDIDKRYDAGDLFVMKLKVNNYF